VIQRGSGLVCGDGGAGEQHVVHVGHVAEAGAVVRQQVQGGGWIFTHQELRLRDQVVQAGQVFGHPFCISRCLQPSGDSSTQDVKLVIGDQRSGMLTVKFNRVSRPNCYDLHDFPASRLINC
jgi:hypothetical protein